MTMKAAQSLLPNFLRRKAVWFVVTAWLLLVLTVLAYLTSGVGAAINAFYHPQHEWAAYDRAVVRVLQLAFWIALLAALGASLALALGWRTIASASVVLLWVGLAAAGAPQLIFVEKGPQQFRRYVGQQQFVVPWAYDPRGADNPSRNGFYVSLCLNSLLGTYDKACREGRQVTILPLETGFAHSFEEISWQRRQDQMKLAGSRAGYQQYIYTNPAEGNRRELTLSYYRCTSLEGILLSLVTCYQSGSCKRETVAGHYMLDYDVPETAFSEWDAIDQKLAALVDSWAVP
jgi:hypothetical protein